MLHSLLSNNSNLSFSNSPQSHIISLKKPPTRFGFFGKNAFSLSEDKIGEVHLLWRIYLKKIVSELKNGRNPKRAILYVKRLEDLIVLDRFLMSQLGHLEFVKKQNTCPWVINSSAA